MWWNENLAAVDCETTGTDREKARIVTATFLEIDPSCRTTRPTRWIADPGIPIPADATKIHKITVDHARQHGRPSSEVVRDISELLTVAAGMNWAIVIYNASYDLTVLDRECRRHGLPTVSDLCSNTHVRLRVVDPLVIDKALDRKRPGSRNLEAVCSHYKVPFPKKAQHTSDGDALAAGRVAWKLSRQFPDELRDLDELQILQKKWHAEQAAAREERLRQKKAQDGASEEEIAAISIPRDWPLIPLAA